MNELVREEEKERFWESSEGIKYSRGKVKYSRRNKVGEGFGKRKVGMRVKIKKFIYGKKVMNEYGFEEREKLSENKVEGIIIRIVRRINNGYYDYWYKVKLDNGKNVWGSYVEIME